jgi:hypothetical protein
MAQFDTAAYGNDEKVNLRLPRGTEILRFLNRQESQKLRSVLPVHTMLNFVQFNNSRNTPSCTLSVSE